LNDLASRGYYDYVSKSVLDQLNATLFSEDSEQIHYSSSPRLFLKRTSSGWHTPILQDEFEKLSSDPRTSNQVKEVDAINFPEIREIRISTSRWAQKDSSSRGALALHEILGLIDQDLDYSVSARFESDMRGRATQNPLGSLIPERGVALESGANGKLTAVQMEIQNVVRGQASRGTTTWLDWNNYRDMEEGAADESFLALLSKSRLLFSFRKTDESHGHVSMHMSSPISDEDFGEGYNEKLDYELDGEMIRAANSSTEAIYYFKGDLKPLRTLYGKPVRFAETGDRYQRTDFYYSPGKNILLMIWFTCPNTDSGSCQPFRFSSRDSSPNAVRTSFTAAQYTLGY
jgi:hypothetical protein